MVVIVTKMVIKMTIYIKTTTTTTTTTTINCDQNDHLKQKQKHKMVIKMTINYGEKQNKNLPQNKATKQLHGMEKKHYHDVSLLSVTVLPIVV